MTPTQAELEAMFATFEATMGADRADTMRRLLLPGEARRRPTPEELDDLFAWWDASVGSEATVTLRTLLRV